MIDVESLKGTKVYWVLQEVVQELERLNKEVERLENEKAAKRGPRKKG